MSEGEVPDSRKQRCVAVGFVGKGKLAQQVLGLNCHMNWIIDYTTVPHKMLVDNGIPHPDWFNGSGKCEEIILSEKLGVFLTKTALLHMGGEVEDSIRALSAAQELLVTSDTSDLHEFHLKAFKYLVAANSAVLALHMGELDLVETALGKALTSDIGHESTTAMLFSVKAAFLDCVGDLTANAIMLKEALKSDPNSPEYLEWLYRSLREIRRKREVQKGPTVEEIGIIEKAMCLDPLSVYTNNSMVSLYHDILKAKLADASYTCSIITELGMAEAVSNMKIFAKRAWDQRHWPSDGIQYAELLLYNSKGRIPNKYCIEKEALDEAAEQYSVCVRGFPEDSGVLHAVGRFCCMYPKSDPEEGVRYIIASLISDPMNLDAFMDYFRFAHLIPALLEPTITQAFIEKIEQHIDLCHSKVETHSFRYIMLPKLLCWKATLMCKEHRFKEALGCWYDAVHMDPEILNSHTFSIFGKGVFVGIFESVDYKMLLNFLLEQRDIEHDAALALALADPLRELTLKKLLQVV